jgi:nitroreductase/NAD-dependent dihydropyrimidine dehydrogenase PreA subunit
LNLLEIDQQTCGRDGLCAAVCPVGLIAFQEGQFPEPIAQAEQLCIRCGHCVAVCPSGSISHRQMDVALCPPVRKELLLSPEQSEHFLRNRRSIRNFRRKPLAREDLQKLIEVARYAPSGHNTQEANWLVLGNWEELHRLAAIVVDWMRLMLVKKPDFAIALHMDTTLERWQTGIDVILRNAPAVVVAHAAKDSAMAPTTCTIALSYLELAATGMGLGCCWAGFFNAAAVSFPPMQAALALPDGHQSFGAMMVGYPKISYQRLPLRKPPKITWRF